MARGNVQVSIGGDVSGQIAIGNNNLQIQNQGGVVNIIKPSSRSPFKKRAGRIHYRPGSLPAFLDRIPESQLVQSSLQNRAPVSVFGESGIGKTTFLSQMAQLPDMDKYPDGVVYLYVPGKGLDDLLQLLFDTFYLTAGNVMPTAGQIRHRLRNVRAIILLDDLALSREDVQALITIMPLSCFVFASLERCLWGSGEVIPLRGLPEKEQVELFARELRRPVSEAEKADARIICFYLQGHPLQIIQAAALVTASGMTISDVKQQFQGTRASSFFEKALLGVLSVSQQKVLALLGTLSGTLLPLSIIGSVLKLVDTKEVLESLVQMGLAWQQGTDYGLAGSLARPISELWNLSSWETALIDYFSAALRQGPADALIQNTSDVLLKVIQKAAERNLWPQVVRLGRALEPFLILDKRWQAWHEVLSLVLKAARASGDPGTEAWALHQLGTRAMCLNFDGQALEFLRRALDLRRTIGDQQGLEVTQHNLDVLRGGAVVHESSTTQQTSLAQNGAGILRYVAYGFGGMAGLGLLALIGWLLWNNPDLFPARTPGPVPTVMPSSIVTPSPTPLIVSATVTSTPTITSTSTETSTPTFTPTYTPTYTITPSFTPSLTPTVTSPATITATTPPGVITGTAFSDNNGNNIPDSGEITPGLTVTLYDSTGGTDLTSTVTNTDGRYTFRNLSAGTYHVKWVAMTECGSSQRDAIVNVNAGGTQIQNLSTFGLC